MPIADTVNTWFQERLACSAIARDTEAYNQALAALPDLIARLEAGETPAAPEESELRTIEPVDQAAPDKAPKKGPKATLDDPPASGGAETPAA